MRVHRSAASAGGFVNAVVFLVVENEVDAAIDVLCVSSLGGHVAFGKKSHTGERGYAGGFSEAVWIRAILVLHFRQVVECAFDAGFDFALVFFKNCLRLFLCDGRGKKGKS